MNPPDDALCRHCLLPLGPRALWRRMSGEDRAFCCYGCCIAFQVKNGQTEEWEAAWLLIRLGVGGFLSMNIMLFSLLMYAGAFTGADARVLPWVELLLWIFATPAVAILGGPYLREALIDGRHGHLTSSTLIVVGVGAAYAYSAVAVIEGGRHVYFDTATMVLMLFTVGRYLEAAGRAKAARSLEPLLAAENACATTLVNGAEIRRPVREVDAGTLVRVLPGERIVVDGVVVEGESHTDEAVMTGESRHIAKGVGSAVIAGSINLDGPLLIRTSGSGRTTRWAQICRSVRETLARRSPVQRIADRLVGAFVPVVLALGLLTALYWSHPLPFDRALLVGLSVLVVACPCAVGLAAPLATSIGIGRLARLGCLVRDPGALEVLARTDRLAFDKTGTLTSGAAHLVAIESAGVAPREVLARAAGLERFSEHALAGGITRAAAAQGVEPVMTHDVRVMAGRGIRGRAGGEMAAAGSAILMRELAWPMPPALARRARALEGSGYSVVYVGWAHEVRAILTLDDDPDPDARATVEQLAQRGVRVMLLTGDLEQAAKRMAAAVGIADVQAGLSPEAKRVVLDQQRQQSEAVAMVGDGLNDGPVLAAADVGIAVGSGTDLARETAALVLPPGGLWMLPFVIDMARSVRRTILGNLMWAFAYNVIALSLAMFGLLQPVLAAAVMAGSSLLVVANSLRLERLPDPRRASKAAQPFSAPQTVSAPGVGAPLRVGSAIAAE
jgi:P-type Cu2+ transporter